uniref:Uncharacterized protein n=1 Tax=Gasterosteus aculeatus aculeatus TaxID=481459 RepID=A0AAQ4RUG9_GASAC
MRPRIASCSKVQEQIANCPKFVPVVTHCVQSMPHHNAGGLLYVPNRSTFVCPFCGAGQLDQQALVDTHAPLGVLSYDCWCCVLMDDSPDGLSPSNFLQHLLHRHKFSYDTFVVSLALMLCLLIPQRRSLMCLLRRKIQVKSASMVSFGNVTMEKPPEIPDVCFT